MPSPHLRHQTINLYKTLLFLGRDYPLGYDYFRTNLRKAFQSQRHLQSDEEVEAALGRGEYVRKEIEALYYLKRYRALKKAYDN